MPERNAIVLVSDANWFPPAAFVADQIARLGPPADTDIVIASDSAEEIAKARTFGLSCEFLQLDAGLLRKEFLVHDYITQATWYRVFLPALLADRYRRILYLDVDVYVDRPKLFALFDLDMSGNSIAAVRDAWACFLDRPGTEIANTIRNPQRKYLNAGVLLIDVPRFIERNLQAAIIRTVKAVPDRLRFADQSAINIVLDGDWLELSPGFNTTSGYWASFCREVCEPVIVHFVGSVKPWHGPRFAVDHPARADLERYLAGTPWKDFPARFYSFADAWKDLAAGRPHPVPTAAFKPMDRADGQRLADYLSKTSFADVEQGLTTIRLDRIPAGL